MEEEMDSLCSWEKENTLHAHKIDKLASTVSELGHRSPGKVEISRGR